MLFQNKLKHELFINAISTLLILSGIVIAQRGVIVFRLASKGIIPNDSVLTILVFGLTKNLPLLISLTLFLAVLSTLTRWYQDSEMIIWFSSGLGISSLIKPFARLFFYLLAFLDSTSLLGLFKKQKNTKLDWKIEMNLQLSHPGYLGNLKTKMKFFISKVYQTSAIKLKIYLFNQPRMANPG